MRFDNAFLTASGNVGVQFTDKREVFTVLREKNGIISFSGNVQDEMKEQLSSMYSHQERKYTPKQR